MVARRKRKAAAQPEAPSTKVEKTDVVEEAKPVVEETPEPEVMETTEVKPEESSAEGEEENAPFDIESLRDPPPHVIFKQIHISMRGPMPRYHSFFEKDKKFGMKLHFMKESLKVNGLCVKTEKKKGEKIVAEIFLNHVYPDHVERVHSAHVPDENIEFTDDAEWWSGQQEYHTKRRREYAEKKIATIEKLSDDKIDAETREKRLTDLKEQLAHPELSDELPDFETVMAKFETPFFRFLVATCLENRLWFSQKVTRTEGGKDTIWTSSDSGDKMEKEWETVAKGVNFNVRIGVEKRTEKDTPADELTAFEAESESVIEARDTVALSCLEQLMADKVIKRVQKSIRTAKDRKLGIQGKQAHHVTGALKRGPVKNWNPNQAKQMMNMNQGMMAGMQPGMQFMMPCYIDQNGQMQMMGQMPAGSIPNTMPNQQKKTGPNGGLTKTQKQNKRRKEKKAAEKKAAENAAAEA